MADAVVFVDTNVFLRILTGDHTRMAADSKRLIERAESGEVELHTSHLALAEIVWTLGSQYDVSRMEIAAMMRDLLGLRSLHVDHKEMLGDAIDLFAAANVDFIDAYHAVDVSRRGIERVVSYDRDFDRLDVLRVEPADV
jgi:predicted nucleic-acid-binding protein